MLLLLLLVCFFCLFDLCLLLLLACLLCAFKFVLLSLFWLVFVFGGAGTGCSYNHLLVSKLAFLFLELYINLYCRREVWL